MSEPANDAFITPVSMEADDAGCFPGDRGVLDAQVRRVLVKLLRGRFLLAERNREEWGVLLENQQLIESRLHDLFVTLVVDSSRGVAYKQQVRTEETEVPILLRDESYTRAETLVLIYLRTVYQRESTAGSEAPRVDVEEVEQTVLTYFSEADGDPARRQRAIGRAMERLDKEGILTEETAGRYRINPLVEIVLSAETLRQMDTWLREHAQQHAATGAEEPEEGPTP